MWGFLQKPGILWFTEQTSVSTKERQREEQEEEETCQSLENSDAVCVGLCWTLDGHLCPHMQV